LWNLVLLTYIQLFFIFVWQCVCLVYHNFCSESRWGDECHQPALPSKHHMQSLTRVSVQTFEKGRVSHQSFWTRAELFIFAHWDLFRPLGQGSHYRPLKGTRSWYFSPPVFLIQRKQLFLPPVNMPRKDFNFFRIFVELFYYLLTPSVFSSPESYLGNRGVFGFCHNLFRSIFHQMNCGFPQTRGPSLCHTWKKFFFLQREVRL
jgi:hypothetical protein